MAKEKYSPRKVKYFIAQYQKGIRLLAHTESCLTESSRIVRYSDALECFNNIPQDARPENVKLKINELENILSRTDIRVVRFPLF